MEIASGYYQKYITEIDKHVSFFSGLTGRLAARANGNKLLLVITDNVNLVKNIDNIVKTFSHEIITVNSMNLESTKKTILEDGKEKIQGVILDYSSTDKKNTEENFHEWQEFVEWIRGIPFIVLATPECVNIVEEINAIILNENCQNLNRYAEALGLVC